MNCPNKASTLYRKIKNMKKIAILTTLLASLLFFSACADREAPSPLDTRASEMGDLNPDNLPGDSSGFDSMGLSDRGIGGLGDFDPEKINPEDIVSTIYFGFDQYAVPQSERANVKKAVQFFASNPGYKIVLVGHTDWYGTEEYNLLLSDKRCMAVLDYMVSSGESAQNINTIGRGEAGASPDVGKDSPEARHDRRVDIVKIK